MPKYITALCLFLIISVSIEVRAQTELSSVDLELEYPDNTELVSIVDNQGNTNLFFISKEKIDYIKYDDAWNHSFKKTYPRPPKAYSKLQGYGISNDDTINLYFSNKDNDNFFLVSVKENEKTGVSQLELDLDKKERFFEGINVGNQFHMFTFFKGTSIIKRHTFTAGTINTVTYNLESLKFRYKMAEDYPLGKILKNYQPEIIEEKIPTSIEIASKKIKFYPSKEDVLITLNHTYNETKTIRLKIDSDEFEVGHFDISDSGFEKSYYISSNSYVYENYLLQLIASKTFCRLTVHDMLSKNKIREYTFSKDQEIPFKNSPIYQEGTYFSPWNNKRTLEHTRQFLRKIATADVGVVAFSDTDKFQLSIGGVKEMATMGGGAPIIMSGGTTTIPGAPGYGPITIRTASPTYYNFSSYANTKSVYIKGLFENKTFKHIEGNAEPNIFDKISTKSKYLKNTSLKKKLKLETVFKKGDSFVYGYYNKKEKNYTLIQFDQNQGLE